MKLRLLSLSIFTLLLAACGGGDSEAEQQPEDEAATSDQQVQEETEASENTETVNILTSVTGGKDEEEMELFEEELENISGYPVDMEQPASDYNNILIQKLRAGGENLDLIYFDQSQLHDLVDQGALLDITEYVNDSEILSDPEVIAPEEWDNIEIDGSYYAGFNKKEIHRVVNLNQSLMDEHGLELKEESLDGYYNLFTDMKESVEDPDFYPLNTVLSELYDIQPWMASEGLRYGIVENDSGNAAVPYASDDAVVVWEWLQMLYEEELLDPSSMTDSTTELRNKFQSGQTGVAVDWAAWTGLYNAGAEDDYPENFEAVPVGGTLNEEDEYSLTRGVASLWGIPATSENVEGAMAVLESFATQEGGDLLSVGIKGHDYNIENGEFEQTETGKSHSNDHGAPFPVNEQYENPAEYNPGVEEAMELLDYAEVPSVSAETNAVQQIVAEHGMNIVSGSISAEEGVQNMRDDLTSEGIIE